MAPSANTTTSVLCLPEVSIRPGHGVSLEEAWRRPGEGLGLEEAWRRPGPGGPHCCGDGGERPSSVWRIQERVLYYGCRLNATPGMSCAASACKLRRGPGPAPGHVEGSRPIAALQLDLPSTSCLSTGIWMAGL